MAQKPCLERVDGVLCGVLSPESRCPPHRRMFEAARKLREPWRLLYEDPRWTATSLRVRQRDGYRCTFQVGSRRCATIDLLSCHHDVKLRILWERYARPQPRSDGWGKFIRAALDERNLRTLCENHHRYVDRNDPDVKRALETTPVSGTSASRKQKQASDRFKKRRARRRRAAGEF